jgi:antitoxin HicB
MTYTAKITQEDGDYIVSFPDKPNVNTCGETLDEALAMAEEALNATLECELDHGVQLVASKVKANSKRSLYAIPVQPDIELAYLIFEARQNRPVAKVAKAAGLSKEAYQRFETPRGNPTWDMLNVLAKALGKHLEVRLA